MKNWFLLLLFIPFLSISQEVSPYFPTPFSSENRYETQMTYFDLNFVSLKVQDFFSRKFLMQQSDSKANLKEGKGTITNIYEDKIAINRDTRKVNVTYEVFPIGNEFVIKNVQIEGDYEVVTKFYVYYWSTDLNFGDLKDKEIAKNYFLQDRISYSSNNGNTIINIVNTAIEDEEKFTKDYLEKKQKFDVDKKALDLKKEQKIAAYKKEEKRAAIQKTRTYKYDVVKKKKKLTYKQSNQYLIDKNAKSEHLKKGINSFMENKKRGVYLIKVIYKYENDKLISTDFKVEAYQKSKGLLDYISH